MAPSGHGRSRLVVELARLQCGCRRAPAPARAGRSPGANGRSSGRAGPRSAARLASSCPRERMRPVPCVLRGGRLRPGRGRACLPAAPPARAGGRDLRRAPLPRPPPAAYGSTRRPRGATRGPAACRAAASAPARPRLQLATSTRASAPARSRDGVPQQQLDLAEDALGRQLAQAASMRTAPRSRGRPRARTARPAGPRAARAAGPRRTSGRIDRLAGVRAPGPRAPRRVRIQRSRPRTARAGSRSCVKSRRRGAPPLRRSGSPRDRDPPRWPDRPLESPGGSATSTAPGTPSMPVSFEDGERLPTASTVPAWSQDGAQPIGRKPEDSDASRGTGRPSSPSRHGAARRGTAGWPSCRAGSSIGAARDPEGSSTRRW